MVNKKFRELENTLSEKLCLCRNNFSKCDFELFEDEIFNICGQMEMAVSEEAFQQGYLSGFRTAANTLAKELIH